MKKKNSEKIENIHTCIYRTNETTKNVNARPDLGENMI